jgi:hypothetical protein
MSQPPRRKLPDPSLSTHEECDEERIAEVMRKIAYVAACIDLYRWRNVIDQVLREVEAERRAAQYPPCAEDDWRGYPEKRFSAYAGPRRLSKQAA